MIASVEMWMQLPVENRASLAHRRWFGMIADGMTPDDVVAELPPLKLDDVSAALRFAADAVADREIPLQPTA